MIPNIVEHAKHVNKDGLSNLIDLDVRERCQIVIVYQDWMKLHTLVLDALKDKEDQVIKELVNNLLHVLETFNTMVYGTLNTVEHAEHAHLEMDT